MVVATEELSRGSLGAGGSLITRPEILARALVKGGTEEQKQRWLPRIATGELMNAVAVTEPDYGSDVAGIKVTATPTGDGDGWLDQRREDVVHVRRPRRSPDAAGAHRSRPVQDPPGPVAVHRREAAGRGPGFVLEDERGGRMEGRAIDTIGYRGMHSFEIAFDNWFVPAENLVGGDDGLGRGFYLQMAGFENGRLQTAARAIGVMQAAYEAARAYADDRDVFGCPIGEYQLTRAKLGRMAVTIQAARQFAYVVARLMAKGEGTLEAAMVKAYVCKAAEWVTREAQQIHGGMGYAEEFAVSRYFVDARVLSIFEGADETLCLKIIARRLVEQAAATPGLTRPGSASGLLRRPGQAGPLAPPHELGRHLAAGLVDHLVAEHHRALALALGGVLVGLEDVPGLVELLLGRAEDLVDDGDLVGVQGPLAVVAEDAGPHAVVAEGVLVADLEERPVDDLEAVGPARHEDLVEDVVEVVAGVLGDLHAAGEHRHLHRGGEVGGAEDDRLEAGRGGADLLDVDEALGRLDLGLDADVADRAGRPGSRTGAGPCRRPRPGRRSRPSAA